MEEDNQFNGEAGIDMSIEGLEDIIVFDGESEDQSFFGDTKSRSYSDLVKQLKCFNREIFSPSSVLYPGCGNDASPSEVFDNLTYVDIDPKSLEMLEKNGLKTVLIEAKKYRGNHDLILLYNSDIPSSDILPNLNLGGYVLANEWKGHATEMTKNENFEVLGVITLPNKGIFRKKSEFLPGVEALKDQMRKYSDILGVFKHRYS